MSVPVLGRNARLFKDNVAIGYGKNISVKATAEIIKDYSMDSLQPAVTGSGKQTFTWSMERLYTDDAYLTILLAGTPFDLVYAPRGSPYESTDYETWKNQVNRTLESSRHLGLWQWRQKWLKARWSGYSFLIFLLNQLCFKVWVEAFDELR